MEHKQRTREEIISALTQPGIIAVIRTKRPEQVLPVCEALVAGGITALEITMTVPGALDLIRQVHCQFDGQAITGAGSVLDAHICRAAMEAGAGFIVSPIGKAEIAQEARASGAVVMLGAYTPTEAQAAHEAGADFVKIFPADGLGPGYIKSLLAPLPHLRLVPTGGVVLENAADFLKAGCAALGVGSSLISKKILDSAHWPELTQLARAFIQAASLARPT
jgi:2-dehydro-3-deoxyphosphogluconate aldolase / (4S)-4-hydroxy-2-oxoglutarate aldolase